MSINDKIVAYLEIVESRRVTIRHNRYVCNSSGPILDIDHLIAVQAEVLGLTRIITDGRSSTLVGLTHRGSQILEDDREAWG